MANSPYFADKVAVITGASTGIGRALAIELARLGARVVLASRNVPLLGDLSREVERLGARALVVPTDVTSTGQVTHLIDHTQQTWGPIDFMIANSGLYLRGDLSALKLSDFETAMDINFFGMLRPVLGVLPQMLERRSGHIVMMCSIDGRKGLATDAPYVSAKFAMSGFSGVLRQELRGTGVHSTIVYPGRVDTAMISKLKFKWISPKISAESVARATLRGMRQQASEVIIPFHGRGLIYVDTFAPRLADWFARVLKLEGWE